MTDIVDQAGQADLDQMLRPQNPAAPQSANSGQADLDRIHATEPRRAPTHGWGTTWDGLVQGLEISVGGLALRRKKPEELLAEDSPYAAKLAAFVGQTLGDLPTLLVGGLASGLVAAPAGPGALVAGYAGAGALTEGARAWMMSRYAEGADEQTIAQQITSTLWAASKGAVVYGATGGVGGKVAGSLAAATLPTRIAAATTAEMATMVTVSKALEGQLPKPQDFLDAAIMLGGLKLSFGIAAKLRQVYTSTGQKPMDVVQRAAVDPALHDQLVDPLYPAIPEALKPAEQPASTPPPEMREILKYPYPGSLPDDHPLAISARNIETSEDAQLVMGRLAEVYAKDINEQRRGTISVAADNEAARLQLKDWVGPKGLEVPEHEIGTVENSTWIRARLAALKYSAEDVAEKVQLMTTPGRETGIEEQAMLLVSMDKLRLMYEAVIGVRAEVGRALNAFKKAAGLLTADRLKALKAMLDDMGGSENVKRMSEMLGEIIDNPRALIAVARKATTFEKFVSAWKMGLISGFKTQEVNFLSNILFAATRIPKETLAGFIGTMHGGEGVRMQDTIGLIIGMTKGSLEGFKIASAMMRNKLDKVPTGEAKEGGATQFTSGLMQVANRLTFDALDASDALARTMNVRGEAYMQAMRIAREEGTNGSLFSDAYWGRVHDLVNDPTSYMKERMTAAGQRYTFREQQAGGIVSSLHSFKRLHPWLNFIIPFDTTPAAIFREMTRMTPFAPIVKKWREDFAAGGERRDRAIADVVMGSAAMTAIWYLAQAGLVTGAGGVTPEQRRAERESGKLPYSFYHNGRWISYNRLDPLGTLFGLAADLQAAWRTLDGPQRDKAGAVAVMAAANVLNNKTWLKGLSDFVAAIADPAQKGNNWMEGMVSGFVPGIVGQTATGMDPYVRDVNSIIDAVHAKVPGWRKTLPRRYDMFGQPLIAPTGAVHPGSPFLQTTQSTDKAYTEMARLGIGPAEAPRNIAIRFPGRPYDSHIDLTDEQREQYSKTSGGLAYQILSNQVNSPSWEQTPDMVKRQVAMKAFNSGRYLASVQSLPIEQRGAAINQLRQEYGM